MNFTDFVYLHMPSGPLGLKIHTLYSIVVVVLLFGGWVVCGIWWVGGLWGWVVGGFWVWGGLRCIMFLLLMSNDLYLHWLILFFLEALWLRKAAVPATYVDMPGSNPFFLEEGGTPGWIYLLALDMADLQATI